MTDHVAAIARRELGAPPESVERVAEGRIRETHELRCDGGEYVVQVADPDDRTGHSLRRGLGCYAMLADTEVPVPTPVTDAVGEIDGRPYTVVEKLPGSSAKLDVSPARARNAGRWLATLHGVASFETAGPLRFEGDLAAPGGTPTPAVRPFPAGNHREAVRGDVAWSVDVLREAGLTAAADAVESLFDGGDGGGGSDGGPPAEFPPTDFEPVLCHGDYGPDNLLYRGDSVVGVIDFDDARAGHRQRDLARAATAFWMHDPGADWDVRAAVYEGYRAVADPGEDFERNEPRYRVETLAYGVAGLHELDGLSDYERDYYDERIVAAVERARRV